MFIRLMMSDVSDAELTFLEKLNHPIELLAIRNEHLQENIDLLSLHNFARWMSGIVPKRPNSRQDPVELNFPVFLEVGRQRRQDMLL